MTTPTLIDIPFDLRHHCWFCGEPCNDVFAFYATRHTPHPPLSVPACHECHLFARKAPLSSIWDCHQTVKDALLKRYQTHLAIGDNWTETELAESEFSCKILSGFRESGWKMYLIAKSRINFRPWPLTLEGIDIDEPTSSQQLQINGINFNSLNQAIHHYGNSLGLDQHFLTALINILGRHRFSHALKLAKLMRSATQKDKRQFLMELNEDK
ncbi:hypothetical protein NFHSH190041_20940 [Shewanella sp. NFH-SH190041]|uniref:hypothetical protein n=1 Tax=Shewanella sp. NFH-SH190041 TaxID=2950245 RepID=UPI0021C2D929|nr:hypothetical protein [Shewanella sp. NFH-SH190041]BDM64642.1 hypothetical protein NFHSH190041_20940 [Shewanella sp. NFH-SH190041]